MSMEHALAHSILHARSQVRSAPSWVRIDFQEIALLEVGSLKLQSLQSRGPVELLVLLVEGSQVGLSEPLGVFSAQ